MSNWTERKRFPEDPRALKESTLDELQAKYNILNLPFNHLEYRDEYLLTGDNGLRIVVYSCYNETYVDVIRPPDSKSRYVIHNKDLINYLRVLVP